jgi:formylglycine-generating enzyme required for sulfatase activity
MLRFFIRILQSTIVLSGAVFLSTLAINAADSLKNPSDSLLAGALSGISKQNKTGCPDGMAYIGSPNGSFCIDIYENSPNDSCAHKNPANQSETRDNLNDPSCQPVSEKGATPWRFVSQYQAMSACAKAGKRLPSNEEWFFAALGTPDMSSGWTKSDCNTNKNRDVFDPAITGSGEKCVSSFGVYDMIGNVWEWTGETINEGNFDGMGLPGAGYITDANEKGIPTATATSTDENYNSDRFWIKKEGTVGMFRGGFWGSGSDAGVLAVHAEMPTSFNGVALGFRCVK